MHFKRQSSKTTQTTNPPPLSSARSASTALTFISGDSRSSFAAMASVAADSGSTSMRTSTPFARMLGNCFSSDSIVGTPAMLSSAPHGQLVVCTYFIHNGTNAVNELHQLNESNIHSGKRMLFDTSLPLAWFPDQTTDIARKCVENRFVIVYTMN